MIEKDQTLNNSYRFFQNRQCEYFPCHEVADVDSFNCLFCYCPLYLQEDCLGHPGYILNGKGQRIRDCSGCTVVHRPEMYDEIIKKLGQQDFEVTINIWNLREQIWERMAQIASWEQMEPEMYRQHRSTAISSITNVFEKNKHLYLLKVLLQPFSAECIREDRFVFGRLEIPCRVLGRIDRRQVQTGYLYAFHAPLFDMEGTDSLLTQYYLEIFQIACMDIVREWTQGYLERKHSIITRQYCSPSFGPGFYGMELDAVPGLLELLEAEKLGIRWKEQKMEPLMSLAGIYLVSREDILSDCRDCISCIGQSGGCRFCTNYHRPI